MLPSWEATAIELGEVALDGDRTPQAAGRRVLKYLNQCAGDTRAGATMVVMAVFGAAMAANGHDPDQIEEFFATVNIDLEKMFGAWMTMAPKDRRGPFSVAILPGSLRGDADIYEIVKALYAQKASDTAP